MKPNLPSPFVECETCEGDGICRCDNPDHGFIGALGCPVCGYDPEHKVHGEDCYDCKGRGWFLRRMTPADWLAETGREYVGPVWIYFTGDCWHSAHWALEEDPRWAVSIFEQEDILIAWPGFGPPDGEEWEEWE